MKYYRLVLSQIKSLGNTSHWSSRACLFKA